MRSSYLYRPWYDQAYVPGREECYVCIPLLSTGDAEPAGNTVEAWQPNPRLAKVTTSDAAHHKLRYVWIEGNYC